jgi:Uma2 family endonuclease
MNVTTLPKPFTYDDYLALPDDGKRYEVIEGDLSVTPAPSPRHQEILLNLSSALRAFVEQSSLGKVYVSPVDVALSLIDIVQPDILFIAKERLHIVAKRNIVGIPNLIVEILSPTSAAQDRVEKLALYQRYALPEYWIVDPEKESVETYLYHGNQFERTDTMKVGNELRSRQIAGFRLEIVEIFR